MRRNEAYMTNQELNTHQIKVIGHCNPDTDSICSAIAYSRLKNMIDPDHPCKLPGRTAQPGDRVCPQLF